VLVLDVVEPFHQVGELHGADGAGELAAGGVLLEVGQDEAAQLGAAQRPLLVGGERGGRVGGGGGGGGRGHGQVLTDLK